MLEALLANGGFGPDERLGVLIVGFDERIDVLSELRDGCEGRAVQGFVLQDREPDLALIEPGGAGRGEVEANVGVTLEPTIVLGLMGVEVVEDDVDWGIGIGSNDAVHEREEFDASPSVLV